MLARAIALGAAAGLVAIAVASFAFLPTGEDPVAPTNSAESRRFCAGREHGSGSDPSCPDAGSDAARHIDTPRIHRAESCP